MGISIIIIIIIIIIITHSVTWRSKRKSYNIFVRGTMDCHRVTQNTTDPLHSAFQARIHAANRALFNQPTNHPITGNRKAMGSIPTLRIL